MFLQASSQSYSAASMHSLIFFFFEYRMDNAFLFVENTTGICAEEDYPYAGHKHWLRGCFSEQGLCTTVPHTRVEAFVDVRNTVEDLLDALAEQPVSVAIEADQQVFQFYKSVSRE